MINYFKLLNLPQAPDVDLELLENNYLEIIARLHPDSNAYISVSDQSSKFSAEDLNRAYKALKDDQERFLHLLKVLGITEEVKVEDLEFFMKFINYREVLEDAASDIDKLREMKKKLTEEKSILIIQIKKDFAIQEYACAQANIAKLGFYRRIIDQITEKEEDLYEAI